MKKFFQKLKRDCRGAVTVFVALMLLPAVLVTGTGVDISRIYAARSTLQDANQLAANSALASYNALLQDLYGLYGVMQSDSELADMMDRYIRMTIFGEDWQDRSMGTFAHFYGERSSLAVEVKAAPGKNLENPEVLRRQIEEYAKFRAPAVIAREVLDKLDTFEKIKEDASVIKDKMDIDDKVDEIDRIYKKLYKCINHVNQAEGLENNSVQSVNSFLKQMETTIDGLYTTRNDEYTEAALDEDEDRMGECEEKYKGLFDNLHSLVSGGTVCEGYIKGRINSHGDYVPGGFSSQTHTDGLEPSAQKHADGLKAFISNSSLENDSLRELLSLAESADRKKAELARMVDSLEAKLNSGKCSEDLRKGMTETKNARGETYLDTYRSLLKYDITPMARAMKDHDEAQINATVEMLTNVVYGNRDQGTQGTASMTYLKQLDETRDGYQIKLIDENRRRSMSGLPQLEDKLSWLDSISSQKYEVPRLPLGTAPRGFEKFQSSAFNSTHNQEFYGKLSEMYGAKKDNDSKKGSIIKGLTQVAGKLQDRFKGLLEFEPLGAWNYTKGTSSGSGDDGGSAFGSDGDWGSSGQLKAKAKSALNDSLLSRISNAGNSAANKLLLLAYDSEMFSCYATNAGYSGTEQEARDEPTEKSMAGIPLGIKVNYYFQSELEYLYHGNLNSAKANLVVVTGMILLVRFVMDYNSVIQTNSMGASDAITFRVIDGSLPDGVVLQPNGTLYGMPTRTGVYTFTVEAAHTTVETMKITRGYTITIKDNTLQNVEASTDENYKLIDRVPDVVDGNSDQVFRSEGPFAQFYAFYLDGRELIRDTDYTAEEGSTRVTIRSQTLRNAGSGSHTLAAEFRTDRNDTATVKRAAQNYTLSTGTSGSGSTGGSTGSGSGGSGGMSKPSKNPQPATPATPPAPVTPPEAGSAGRVFNDIRQTDWFYSDVDWAYQQGLMIGVTGDTFAPNGPISTATVITVLSRLGRVDLTGYDPAGDPAIPAGAWYGKAAAWAKQMGLLPDDFAAQPTISRAKLAVMLVKYLKLQGVDCTPPEQPVAFADAGKMTAEENAAFQILYGFGIFKGDGSGSMNPLGFTSRAHLAALLHRLSVFVENGRT